MTNFYHPPILFCSCQVPPRPLRHESGGERREGKDQRQGQLCVPKAPQNTGTIEASSSQTLLKLLWGLCVLPHAAGVVQWVAMSLRWVYTNCRFGQRGIIHLHIQEIYFIFPFHISVFSFSPCPATSLQRWTGNISCLPPAVNHHLSNTTTDADSFAWLFREDAVLADRRLISTWRGAKALLKGWWRTAPGINGSVPLGSVTNKSVTFKSRL